ncbi:hypothetical protein BVC80_869g52 [Macleaya cordata]|uniref:Uncharacterized protein n=1 Tax=Macleaya cordata TaxID=56857 RepID=A0A200Q319_MACCD|nr:hypothetical protein BVC80_869g52 [Macleaya cordata]
MGAPGTSKGGALELVGGTSVAVLIGLPRAMVPRTRRGGGALLIPTPTPSLGFLC